MVEPTQAPTRVRVVVARGNRILMVQHSDGAGPFWVLPGGGVKPGESLEQAGVREVWEETGVRCRIVRKLDVPAGVTAMHDYALLVGELEDDDLAPAQDVDGEVVLAVAWHVISDEHPIGPLTARFWSAIAPLLRELIEG